MPTPLTDADKVLRNDTGKDIVSALETIADNTSWAGHSAGDLPLGNTTPTGSTAAAIGSLSSLTTTDKSSLVDAVNEVNANKADTATTYTKTETETKIDSNFKRASTSWGTSVTLPVDRNQFMVMTGNNLFVVWFAGTNEVQVRSIGNNTTASGTNTVTHDNVTFTRNALRLTVTRGSNDAITIIA